VPVLIVVISVTAVSVGTGGDDTPPVEISVSVVDPCFSPHPNTDEKIRPKAAHTRGVLAERPVAIAKFMTNGP